MEGSCCRLLAGCLVSTLLLAACVPSIGPGTISRDRSDYGSAIARAGQEQMLSNLVKLRYSDTPVFLEVSSIINQYALEGQLAAGGQFPGITDRTAYSVNGAARYADRPTITYAPLAGEKFIKSLLTPIRPETLFSLVQAGWPIDVVFHTSVRAVNGVYNRSRTPILAREPDPDFLRLLAALRRIQAADALGFRIEDRKEGDQALIVFRSTRVTPEVEADVRTVHEILHLAPDATSFRLKFGNTQESGQDIALLSRSMLEMMTELAAAIEVPEAHVAEKRVNPTNRTQTEAEEALGPPMRVCSGAELPPDAFVSVRYRDTWFWIDDRDFASKREFNFLTIFFELASAGVIPAAPLVTIGAGS